MSTPASAAAIIIRPLHLTDTHALEWYGGRDRRSFYEAQTHAHVGRDIHVVVADHGGFPVGQAAIHWNGKPTHPQIPDIQSVRVHPDFRGLGIGSRLLHECERLVKERGFEALSLSVALDNEAAKRLYERLGYRLTGAPYTDVWYYADAEGQSVRVEETVLDMVKNLHETLEYSSC